MILERNPNDWKEARPHLDAVEFRTSLSASAIASGLRSGEIELARDLLPQDLEAVLREPRLERRPRRGAEEEHVLRRVQLPGRRLREPAVRRALAGVVRSQDFVWSTLGRFALPATGLIPPGTLGHDPGRRRPLLPKDDGAPGDRVVGRHPSPVAPGHGSPDPPGPLPLARGRGLRHVARSWASR